ncbi:lipase 4 [Diutina catenulata]
MQLLSLLLLVSLAYGALIAPLKPTEDPFYRVPAGLNNITEGTILRQRPAPAAIRSILLPAKVESATQYLVRSVDQLGNPTAIVTTLLKPFNANPNKLVSHNMYTDTSAKDCAPSYSILFGAMAQTINTQLEMLFVQLLLNKGYNVVIPDHQGPSGAFIQGKMAAHAVLDSIRAVLAADNGVSPNARVVEWGYSGGSLPTMFSAAAQPKYAPDLKGKLVGATCGGVVTDVEAVARNIDGTLFAGLLLQALAGFQTVYPGVKELIVQQISPQHYKFFQQAYNFCVVPSSIIWTLQNFFTGPFRWAKDGWDVFNLPLIRKILNDCLLGSSENPGVPEIPVMMYHGKLDEIVPFNSNPERIYNLWCQQNVGSLEFNVDLTGFHFTTFFTGLPAAYKFMDDRLNGVAPRTRGCKRTDRLTNFLIPGTDPTLFPLVVSTLSSWLGFDIGPKILANGGDIWGAIGPKLSREAAVPDPKSVPGYIAPQGQRNGVDLGDESSNNSTDAESSSQEEDKPQSTEQPQPSQESEQAQPTAEPQPTEEPQNESQPSESQSQEQTAEQPQPTEEAQLTQPTQQPQPTNQPQNQSQGGSRGLFGNLFGNNRGGLFGWLNNLF